MAPSTVLYYQNKLTYDIYSIELLYYFLVSSTAYLLNLFWPLDTKASKNL